MGVNTHVSTIDGSAEYPVIVSLFKTLGLRHVRDAIIDNNPGYDTSIVELLGSNAQLDGLTDCAGIAYNPNSPTSPAEIAQFDAAIGNRMDAVEGPNEVDVRGDANWVADTTNCLPGLRGALPQLPFIAPSLANPNADASALGNISSLVDYGNIHRYFSGRNPGSGGWGGTFSCGTYGALTWAICLAQVNTGSKPLIVTETGYNSQTEVDEATQAKYLSRAFLVNLKAGISHSFAYVLKDYAGDAFGGDGLIRADDSVKPAFTAIENEYAYFSDSGIAGVLNPISYALSNASLDHVLFRKRDGSYILALWNETASWNVSTNSPIVVAPVNQTMTLSEPPSSVSASSLTDTGALVSAPAIVTANTISTSIDDHVTLLHFTLP